MTVCSPTLFAPLLKHENKILTHLGEAALRMHNPLNGISIKNKDATLYHSLGMFVHAKCIFRPHMFKSTLVEMRPLGVL